jgi:hypothetical protein
VKAEDLDQCLRMRYQVYCLENPFEDPAAHSGERETDRYTGIPSTACCATSRPASRSAPSASVLHGCTRLSQKKSN